MTGRLWSIVLVAAAVCGLMPDSSARLDQVACSEFFDTVPVLTLADGVNVTFSCSACRTFFHDSYFIVYGSALQGRYGVFVAAVHACRNVTTSALCACVHERRGFPVSQLFQRALEARINEFGRPLFVRNDSVPNARDQGEPDADL